LPTARQSVLGCVLRRVGSFSTATFPERLKLQKTVYLLQAFGIYLGYPFNWYLYGPYSPQLTRDAFEVTPRLGRFEPLRFTDRETERRFQQFLAFLGDRKDDPKWLELVASLHMLARIYGADNTNVIFEKVAAKQPYLSEGERSSAWRHLRDDALV
jgi:uncharacterized protein YwgA